MIATDLELQSLSLLLLVSTKLKVLASLEGKLSLGLAADTLETENHLLGGLSLLVENGLDLTTITSRLSVVSSLTLGVERGLTGLVLGDLVLGVLTALFALAECSSSLGDVDHFCVCGSSQQAGIKYLVRAGIGLGSRPCVCLPIGKGSHSHILIFQGGDQEPPLP